MYEEHINIFTDYISPDEKHCLKATLLKSGKMYINWVFVGTSVGDLKGTLKLKVKASNFPQAKVIYKCISSTI